MAANLNLVLVGPTGSGKSTIGNLLVYGADAWRDHPTDGFSMSGSLVESCTRDTKSIFSPLLRCNVVDTPGTEDLDKERRVEMLEKTTTAIHERASFIGIVVAATRAGVDSTVRAIHAITRMIPLMDATRGVLLFVNHLPATVMNAEDAAMSIEAARADFNALLKRRGCEFQVMFATGMRGPDCMTANGHDLVEAAKVVMEGMSPIGAGTCRKFSEELRESREALESNGALTLEYARKLEASKRSIKELEEGFNHHKYWYEHHKRNGIIMAPFPVINMIGVPVSVIKAGEHLSEMSEYDKLIRLASVELDKLDREGNSLEGKRKTIEAHVKLLDDLVCQEGGVLISHA